MKQISAKEEKEYKDELEKYLLGHYNVSLANATTEQIFRSLSGVVCNKLYELKEKENSSGENRNAKTVHYVSIEFLLGKSLKSHLWNLGLEKAFKNILKKANKSLEDVYEL